MSGRWKYTGHTRLDERILAHLAGAPGRTLTSKDAAQEFGSAHQTALNTLSRLAAEGKLERKGTRTRVGRYGRPEVEYGLPDHRPSHSDAGAALASVWR